MSYTRYSSYQPKPSYSSEPSRAAGSVYQTTYGSSYNSLSLTGSSLGSSLGSSRAPAVATSTSYLYSSTPSSSSSPSSAHFKSKYSSGSGPSMSQSHATGSSSRYQGGATSSDIDYISIFAQVAQITESLYLSSAHPVTEARMKALGVGLVVNATLDVRPIVSNEIETMRITVDDSPYASLKPYFDRVADRVHEEVRRGGKVLIHCVAGVSRSASLVMVYLMKHRRMTLRDAHDHVKSRRPVIRPNMGFWKQLVEYEEKLRGVNSVKMITSAMGWIPDVYAHEARGMWVPIENTKRRN